MLLKTILNRFSKYKSFVYGEIRFNKQAEIEVKINARQNSRGICSGCGVKGSGYDRLPERFYEFVPLWGTKVYFIYKPRRINCQCCGVTVERVPWAEGKKHHTSTFELFLAHWAKKLSWQEVADEFRVHWNQVFRAVEFVVEYGLKHRDLSRITAIGIDEIHWGTTNGFLTIVYQIDKHSKRLLFVAENRTVRSILKFFRMLGKERCLKLEVVCSDMWQAYVKVIKKKAINALHILDRFHIVSNLNKALDEVRASEARDLHKKGIKVLENSRWCFIKKPENLTEKQSTKLTELFKINLKSIRAYLLKEDFNLFWRYESAVWAGKFLDQWCSKVMRSKIAPMKKIAKSIRKHRQLILNWFKAEKLFSSSIVEGFNNKAKVAIRKAYGFKTFKALEIALFHNMGQLPQPHITHKFW
jgi:transposase